MTLPASYFEDSAEFERKVCLEIPKLIILEETMPQNTFEEYFQCENTFRSAILGSVLGAPLCLCLDLESSDCSKNHDPAGLLGCAFLAKSVTSNPFSRPDLVLAVFMHILIPWVCS